MSDPVITVENLSKSYLIGHQGPKEQYTSLRDTLSKHAKNFTRRTFDTLRGKQMLQGDSVEEFWALKDVNFEVQRGEVLGIIGRNGAGKSTLLKVLSRITEPTKGKVTLEGRVASLLEVGTGFHPELSGRENIYLNGAILGMSRREIKSKFDEIVDFAGVEKFLDTPVKRYSSGMYVRLAFAVAAHLEPEILIVDEVLAVGDAQFQEKCLGKMKDVAQGGRTVLFVSHQMNAVEKLCSRVIRLDSGQLKNDTRDIRSIIRNCTIGSDSVVFMKQSRWIREDARFDNEWFSPEKFFIGDQHGNDLAMPINNNIEIWVYIEAKIQQLDPSLTIGYAVFSESGEIIYWSYQSDTAPEKWPIIEKGTTNLRAKIPSHLLNEGAYRVELIGGLHHRVWLFEPSKETPQISLKIQGGLSDSPLWTEKRPGILAPVIQWSRVP